MIGWKTFCALFLAHRYVADTSERIDAALAETMEAQGKVRTEAARVADAAVNNRLHIATVRNEIATRIDEQDQRAKHKRLHTGDVRGLVQGMLDSLDAPKEPKKDSKPC